MKNMIEGGVYFFFTWTELDHEPPTTSSTSGHTRIQPWASRTHVSTKNFSNSIFENSVREARRPDRILFHQSQKNLSRVHEP